MTHHLASGLALAAPAAPWLRQCELPPPPCTIPRPASQPFPRATACIILTKCTPQEAVPATHCRYSMSLNTDGEHHAVSQYQIWSVHHQTTSDSSFGPGRHHRMPLKTFGFRRADQVSTNRQNGYPIERLLVPTPLDPVPWETSGGNARRRAERRKAEICDLSDRTVPSFGVWPTAPVAASPAVCHPMTFPPAVRPLCGV